MSPAARAALISVKSNRQGDTPPPTTPVAVIHELTALGILGRAGGLTRKGSGKRQLLMDDVMNETFGRES